MTTKKLRRWRRRRNQILIYFYFFRSGMLDTIGDVIFSPNIILGVENMMFLERKSKMLLEMFLQVARYSH
jgi:hypothetical protein